MLSAEGRDAGDALVDLGDLGKGELVSGEFDLPADERTGVVERVGGEDPDVVGGDELHRLVRLDRQRQEPLAFSVDGGAMNAAMTIAAVSATCPAWAQRRCWAYGYEIARRVPGPEPENPGWASDHATMGRPRSRPVMCSSRDMNGRGAVRATVMPICRARR
jgi:hypothetical protein